MKIYWTIKARAELLELPAQLMDRIIDKMDWYASQDKPLSFAKRLTNSDAGTFRFRIGDYRVLCDVDHGVISVLVVLGVKKREKAYE